MWWDGTRVAETRGYVACGTEEKRCGGLLRRLREQSAGMSPENNVCVKS